MNFLAVSFLSSAGEAKFSVYFRDPEELKFTSASCNRC